MKKDMLKRFTEMKQDAKERAIRITDDQLCQLVIADVIEDTSIALEGSLETIAEEFSRAFS
jgi:hypothetical protein